MSRGGRRTRGRRRPRGKTTDKQRPVDPFLSPFTEWGGELWFVVDYTADGAPIGLRASEIEDVFEHCELDHPSA